MVPPHARVPLLVTLRSTAPGTPGLSTSSSGLGTDRARLQVFSASTTRRASPSRLVVVVHEPAETVSLYGPVIETVPPGPAATPLIPPLPGAGYAKSPKP